MSALGALIYLDACRLRNAARQLLRSPARLALWVLLLLFVPWQIYARLTIFPRDPSYHQPTIEAPLVAALALGGILIALGFVLLGVTRGNLGAFGSSADARFLTASAIAPQLVVLWVQLRAISASLLRNAWGALVVLLFWSVPGGVDASLLGAAAVIVSAAMLLTLRLPLALLLHGRAVGFAAVRVAAIVFIAAGASIAGAQLAAALGERYASAFPIVAVVARWAAGDAVAAHFTGAVAWGYVLAALAAVAALLAAGRRGAADVYPELCASSQQHFRFLAMRRAGGVFGLALAVPEPADAMRRKNAGAVTIAGAWVPAGALAILWKDWLAFTRTPRRVWSYVALLAASIAAGILAPAALRVTSAESLLTGLSSAAINAAMLYAALSTQNVAEDLGKPLWWLCAGNLTARVLVWNLAATWRMGAVVAAGSLAASLTIRSAAPAIAGAIAGPLLLLQFRATGVLVQALLPRTGDLRGPGSLLRMIGSAISLAPPAILATIAVALHLPLLLAAVAAVVGALATVAALSYATAARLRERGAEQALLARSG